MLAQSLREDMQAVTRGWGWFLAAGIAWIVFAFFVLSFNYRTVWAVAVFFGIGFIIGGVMELAVASVAPGWKWLYILIGIVSIIAGVIALIWPGQTFLVLSAIVGWLLLFYGIIDIVFAFSYEAPRRSLVDAAHLRDHHGAPRLLGDQPGRVHRVDLPRRGAAGRLDRRGGPVPRHLRHHRRLPAALRS